MKGASDKYPELVTKEVIRGQYNYTIRFQINQQEDIFTWEEVELPPGIYNRSTIISKLIKYYFPSEKVEAIVNNVLSNPLNESYMEEYKEFQEWRTKVKTYAQEIIDWGEEHDIHVQEEPQYNQNINIEIKPDGLLQLAQALSFVKTQVVDLPDEKAVEVPALFPIWYDKIGQQVNVDDRLFYNKKLWKVLQTHTVQKNWTPDITPSLYTEIVVQQEGEPEIGTLDNPIPYDSNMELFEGKYYIQDNVIYLCTRSSGSPVYHPLSALVGLYVEVVNP